jgi:hypothetical protein
MLYSRATRIVFSRGFCWFCWYGKTKTVSFKSGDRFVAAWGPENWKATGIWLLWNWDTTCPGLAWLYGFPLRSFSAWKYNIYIVIFWAMRMCSLVGECRNFWRRQCSSEILILQSASLPSWKPVIIITENMFRGLNLFNNRHKESSTSLEHVVKPIFCLFSGVMPSLGIFNTGQDRIIPGTISLIIYIHLMEN